MSEPQGVTIGAIQSWVLDSTGYTGWKKRLAAEVSIYVMEYAAQAPAAAWQANNRSNTYWMANAYVKRRIKEERIKRYGFIGGFFLLIFIGVVVNIIVRFIMNWLFPDPIKREAAVAAFTPDARRAALDECFKTPDYDL